MAALVVLDQPLRTAIAPSGIVSFEFAGDLLHAQGIMASWGHPGRVYAGLSLGLDYLYLVLYAGTTALGCGLVAGRLTRRVRWLGGLGAVLSWAPLLAALLDAIEDYALIRVLLGSTAPAWPIVAWWCAGPKFLLVAAGLLYAGIGFAVSLVIKEKRHAAE
jgi:hypothetical protein